MIIGIGTDIVEITRIEKSITKFGDSFLQRCFTTQEIEISKQKNKRYEYFAKRFAAKEAFFKALGTGFTNKVSWQDIEISNDENGKPLINISGRSKDLLDELSNNTNIHISLSDDNNFATAFVIIEKG